MPALGFRADGPPGGGLVEQQRQVRVLQSVPERRERHARAQRVGHAQQATGDGEFVVLKAGRFVKCAVTGALIPLDALRYWSPDLQEAYATPADALARWRELNP